MKAIGVILIALALVVAVVPQFTDCQSQGRSLTLTNGKTVPMKCHWTAMAAIATAIPLGLLGITKMFSKRKETQQSQAVLGATLGAMVILLPTTLIGVCASNEMLCNMIMKPTLIASGSLIALISLGSLFFIPKESGEQTHDAIAVGA